MIRVLLYGDVDLNLIDGSTIWLASVVEVLSRAPDVDLSVLQKTAIVRDVIIRDVASKPNVHFLDPWRLANTNPDVAVALTRQTGRRLSPETAAALIGILDRERPFSVVVVRSLDTLDALRDLWPPTAQVWAYVTDPSGLATASERLKRIARRCRRIICQTDEARAALIKILGVADDDRTFVLPPMIPAVESHTPPALDAAAPRLGYSGKLSPPYMILETLDAFRKVVRAISGAEFHIVGDKFHNMPPVADFEARVRQRLATDPGVVWHGGVSRREASDILRCVNVASSWRAELMDETLEMSTKILEYSALGIPVLMNPSPIQVRVYGQAYPGYVRTEHEFIERFMALTSSPALYEQTSRHVRNVAADFTFDRALDKVMPLLRADSASRRAVRTTRATLWVGHDFKFIEPIKAHFERDIRYVNVTDEYSGHVIPDTARSLKLLRRADMIFCEWCLGNAEWYSKHKLREQRLVVRLHRQELELPYLDRIEWRNVDAIIFIAEWTMRRFLDRFPGMSDRAHLIYNAVDCTAFDMEKLPGAEFNLGLLGIAPQLKAPHLALEILTALKKVDRRYTLFLKGKAPWELDWLWRRPLERQYYEALYAAVNRSPHKNSIVFEPHGDDVPTWFSKIGFLLSTSDLEGSHQAVAEGMASGAIPVIRNWEGADRTYPAKYVFPSIGNAVNLVSKWNTSQYFQPESASCRSWCAEHFGHRVIVRYYEELFASLFEQSGPASTVGSVVSAGGLATHGSQSSSSLGDVRVPHGLSS
jgi:glycosyltransferase involved in cell wall biosynthesis